MQKGVFFVAALTLCLPEPNLSVPQRQSLPSDLNPVSYVDPFPSEGKARLQIMAQRSQAQMANENTTAPQLYTDAELLKLVGYRASYIADKPGGVSLNASIIKGSSTLTQVAKALGLDPMRLPPPYEYGLMNSNTLLWRVSPSYAICCTVSRAICFSDTDRRYLGLDALSRPAIHIRLLDLASQDVSKFNQGGSYLLKRGGRTSSHP